METVETPHGEKEVVYTSLEAPNVRTVISDVATLEDGKAVIDLPEHFGMVTDPDEPLVVDTTPYSTESEGLAITERSVDRIVVEERNDRTYEFAYTVKGIRNGYAEKKVMREVEERIRPNPNEVPEQARPPRADPPEEVGQPGESSDGSC